MKSILIKGKAGLGNRILSTLTGIMFGVLCDRQIVVDWDDGAYAPRGVNPFPRLFSSPAVSGTGVDRKSVAPAIWRDHLDWSVADMIAKFDPSRFSDPTVYRKYCCDLSTLSHPEETIVYWSYLAKFQRLRRHFTGRFAKFRRMPEPLLIHELMRQHLQLKSHIGDEVDAFAAREFQSEMIGVHARYSDRTTPLETIHRDVARALVRRPKAAIFLATDNRAVEAAFQERYPRVVVTEKWLPQPGQALHYNPDNADPERSAIEALKDIYLLSRTSCLVYPRGSTFSYLARCLGNFADRDVIDVERGAIVVRLKRLVQDLV